ncbi:MAG TPA: DUF2127 domain-containing protein [Candidatus Sulfotelmatobacter sp.]|nr:DUF2127 domain-containing protein [Candidatus Sulfotelmatobacter sp.]
MQPPIKTSHPQQHRAIRAIALLELMKGIFVLLMGICAILLVRQDVWLLAEGLLALLHINTDRHFALVFLDFADNITDKRLWAAARIAFAYAGLRFTEGYGLWKERAWAEWVAVVSGTLLLPLEVRELLRGLTTLRVLVFIGNIAIILYMVHVLRTNRRERRALPASASQPESRAGQGKSGQ